LRAYKVHFAPSCRTAWHWHPLGQILYVTDGVGFVQSCGDEAREVSPGDVIITEPREWHWHGAASGRLMIHIALQEVDGSGADSYWGDQVSDDEYQRAMLV
jgi:quercetin dioxygenase-like cupin family protein